MISERCMLRGKYIYNKKIESQGKANKNVFLVPCKHWDFGASLSP